MGVKYTSQSSSGYDSGSPPDDGTTGEDNKCKWSVIKSSLTDILKTFTEAINTELLAFFDFDTNAQSGNYTTLTSDNGKVIECTGSGTITLGAAATMGSGYVLTVKCVSGTETVATSEFIDESASNRSITAGNSETYRVNSAATKYLIESDKITSNIDNVITSRGDIAIGGATGTPEALTVGGVGEVVTSDGTDASWGLFAGLTFKENVAFSSAQDMETTVDLSAATQIIIIFHDLHSTDNTNAILSVTLVDSGGTAATGDTGVVNLSTAWSGTDAGYALLSNNADTTGVYWGKTVLNKTSVSGVWEVTSNIVTDITSPLQDISTGKLTGVQTDMDAVRIRTDSGQTWDAGSFDVYIT